MISKIILEILLKSNSYAFYYFESNSYVLYCLRDEKVRISKIILEILLKSNSYVFYYFKSNSYVLFKWWKVRISKIILEILLKSNIYVFYYFEPISYVLYCLSDEKVRIWMWHLFLRVYSAQHGAKCKAQNYIEPEFHHLRICCSFKTGRDSEQRRPHPPFFIVDLFLKLSFWYS